MLGARAPGGLTAHGGDAGKMGVGVCGGGSLVGEGLSSGEGEGFRLRRGWSTKFKSCPNFWRGKKIDLGQEARHGNKIWKIALVE